MRDKSPRWGEPIPPDDAAQRLFLSRYIDRGPIAESRILITDDIITYLTPKDDITHEFGPLEFLARLTPHIANRWESTTRYFGWYSSRARGKRNKLKVSTTISLAEPLQKKKASKRWAALTCIAHALQASFLLSGKNSPSMANSYARKKLPPRHSVGNFRSPESAEPLSEGPSMGHLARSRPWQ